MIEHVLLAVLLQLAIYGLLKSWMAGALVGSAWSISREITQAEYRWIEQFGSGLRANMPWWGGLDPYMWQKLDPWLDWLVPTMTVLTIAYFAGRASNRPRLRQ